MQDNHTNELPQTALRRFGLRFADRDLETAFRKDYARRIRSQVQLALILGALLYLALAPLDIWFFPDSFGWTWLLRGIIASTLLLALFALRRPKVYRQHQRILALLACMAGVGPIGMIAAGSVEVALAYCFGITLVVAWAYTVSGLRFGAALTVNLLLIGIYLGVSLATGHTPLRWLTTNISHLLAASVLIGFAAYLIERQRRSLFHHHTRLDAERRNQEQRALSDHLTGLPNRAYFERRIGEAIQRARRHRHSLAVLFVDIDRFKPINDRHGHQIGDQLLIALGRRLEESLRANDTVARLGGDEFIVLLEEVGNRSKAETVAAKLRDRLSRPVDLVTTEGARLHIDLRASVGCALFPEDAASGADLLRLADAAMYRDKRRHRSQAAEAKPA